MGPGLTVLTVTPELANSLAKLTDMSEGRFCGLGDFCCLLLIGEITEHTPRFSSAFQDLGGHALGRISFPAVDHNARAFLSKGFGDAFADSGGTASN
jgi:hypothetical protein